MSPMYRFQSRNFIVTLCLSLLFLWLGWSFFSDYREKTQYLPQLQAAVASLQSRDEAGARRVFDQLLAKRSESPEVYMLIASVCASKEQWKLMEEYTRKGLQSCHNSPEPVRAQLGMLLASALSESEQERPQKQAIMAAEDAFQHDPNSYQIQNNLGYILVDNNLQLERAEQLLTRALQEARKIKEADERDRWLAVINDSYGWLLYKKGDANGAINYVNDALSRLNERDYSGNELKVFYYHLGAAYHKANRLSEARNTLGVALQYDPDYKPAKKEMEALGSDKEKPSSSDTPSAPAREQDSVKEPASSPSTNLPVVSLSPGSR